MRYLTVALALVVASAPMGASVQAALTDGLVAYWSFDTDLTATFGGAAFDGADSNGVSIDVGGKFSGAAKFERINSEYISVSSPVVTQGQDHTYSVWYKSNIADINTSDRYCVLETTPNFAASFELRDGPVDIGQVWAQYNSGSSNSTVISGAAGTAWHNIIVTYDEDAGANEHTVYLDGVQVAPINSDPLLGTTTGLNIGAHRGGTGRNFDGLIDDVAFWDRVLTPAEIATLQTQPVTPSPLFTDVTPSALQDSPGFAQGVGWGDYDGDGDHDVYIANEGGGHKLIRNDDTTFVDVTPGLLGGGSGGWSVLWVDYDNDGDLDLFRAGFPNKLFNNDGNGVFSDSSSTLGGGAGDGRSASWGDYDNDGDVDLYVAGDGSASYYFRNDGAAFTNATSGDLADTGGLGMITVDYDDDDDLDIYVVDASSSSRLLRNDDNGDFVNVAASPLNLNGGAGVSAGDYDNDGDFDIYRGNAFGIANKLFHNNSGVFADSTAAPLDITDGSYGIAWGDYDNDGHLDLYVASELSNKLLRNNGDGSFSDVTESPLNNAGAAREATWCDFDGDGDLDLYVVNWNSANKLLRNNLPVGNHWLHLDLEGTLSNRSGIGARVRVVAGGTSRVQQVSAGSSARAQGSLTAEFGLGTATLVDTIEVRWPSGVVQYSLGVGVDQRIAIVEEGVNVTVTTDPPGLDVITDAVTHTAPWQFASGVGGQHTIEVLSPQVFSDSSYVFSGWSDGGAISHQVAPVTDTTYTASFDLYFDHASIDSIADVPDDQGGWVRIYFLRSFFDDATEDSIPVATYGIHRRVDNPSLAALVLKDGKRVDPKASAGLARVGYRLGDRVFSSISSGMQAPPSGVWEVIGTVPASQSEHYIYLAPTLGDSSSAMSLSTYYVSAHTTTPSIFFDSPPDSGYSVDNIAPGVPPSFVAAYNTGSGNQLTWDPVPDNDLQYYNIYRDADIDFTPAPENLVDATTSTTWNDPEYDGWTVYYKVTAVDDAGNEGPPTSSDPATGVDDKPAIPQRFALYQNAPNPFNPTTTIRYDVPAGGGHVTIRIFDVSGRRVRTLVDGVQIAGRKSVAWDGMNSTGEQAASGIYFYRLTTETLTRTLKMLLLK